MNHDDDHAHADERMQDITAFADPVIGTAIGARLRSLFDEFADDPAPDPLHALIDRLEQRERAASDPAG